MSCLKGGICEHGGCSDCQGEPNIKLGQDWLIKERTNKMSIENLKKILEGERDIESSKYIYANHIAPSHPDWNRYNRIYKAGSKAMENRLLPLLEKAVEIMNQIGLARCPNYITHPQSVWFDEHVQEKAREFLLNLSETTESVSDLTKMTEIKKEGL